MRLFNATRKNVTELLNGFNLFGISVYCLLSGEKISKFSPGIRNHPNYNATHEEDLPRTIAFKRYRDYYIQCD